MWFQFHKGTIRTYCSVRTLEDIYNFNSIKVRLEQLKKLLPSLRQKFQFHKGTIRTCAVAFPVFHRHHFNSIKVRLEPGLAATLQNIRTNFNSIKVRLEPPIRPAYCSNGNFNSIKVRLEPGVNLYVKEIELWFQFHKGTIRTVGDDREQNICYHFNSIKVRLELAMLWSLMPSAFHISIP